MPLGAPGSGHHRSNQKKLTCTEHSRRPGARVGRPDGLHNGRRFVRKADGHGLEFTAPSRTYDEGAFVAAPVPAGTGPARPTGIGCGRAAVNDRGGTRAQPSWPDACAGSVVLIHGSVVHRSSANHSANSRIIYTFHMIEGAPGHVYDERNWYVAAFHMARACVAIRPPDGRTRYGGCGRRARRALGQAPALGRRTVHALVPVTPRGGALYRGTDAVCAHGSRERVDRGRARAHVGTLLEVGHTGQENARVHALEDAAHEGARERCHPVDPRVVKAARDDTRCEAAGGVEGASRCRAPGQRRGQDDQRRC